MLGLEANVDKPRETFRNCDGANKRVLNILLSWPLDVKR